MIILSILDKNGKIAVVGQQVNAFNPDSNMDFMGRILKIKQDCDKSFYAEVTDQEDNIFCLNSEDIELSE